jgi:hypothetical protein
LAVTLSLSLIAEVLLGVDILTHAGHMEAGVFLDLPALSVSISSLSNVNAHCESVNSSSSITGFLSHVFPKLINIVPSATLDIGLYASATLAVPTILETHVPEVNFGTSVTLAGTSFALETACLSWDSEATAFVEPTFTPTSSNTAAAPTVTGSGSSGSGGQKNFGTQLREQNPFANKTGTTYAMALILGFIFALAAL